MTSDSLPIACYGKLPSDREYVHHQVGTLAVDGFDHWVRTGHRQAFLGCTVSPDAYDRASAFGVVFPTPDGPDLWAVLTPSRDATGRRYPFWVAWRPPHRQGLCPAGFQRAHSFAERSPADLAALNYGLQLPLAPAGNPITEADFWRNATRRLTDTPTLPLTLFWTMPAASSSSNGSPAASAALYLFPNMPPPSFYAHLFTPNRDPPFVYAPARTPAPHANDTLSALAPQHRRLLHDLTQPPTAFLDALG